MAAERFAELLGAAQEALAHAEGKRQLRTTVLPHPPRLMSADDVRALRAQVNASQAVFAHYLNVSTKLVQAWEADRRRPEGAALRLLEIAASHPAIVFGAMLHPAGDVSAPKTSTRAVRAATPLPTRSAARRSTLR